MRTVQQPETNLVFFKPDSAIGDWRRLGSNSTGQTAHFDPIGSRVEASMAAPGKL
jgi:hypothetical protein